MGRVMSLKAITATALAAGLLCQNAAAAQVSSDDWDIVRDERTQTTLAFTAFDNGISIAFRCIDGSLNTVIAGLPPSASDRRNLQVSFRGKPAYESGWTATTDSTVVVGDFPAPFAREFREGGELRLTVPNAGEGGRNVTFVNELPQSSTVIDEVLTTCGKPLVDPRDATLTALGSTGLPDGLTWRRAPRPEFPQGRYASGFVVATCLSQSDGSLTDCEVEMEHPHDGGFGQAALRGVGRARLVNTAAPDDPIPTGRVSFRTQFRLEEPRSSGLTRR